VKAVRNVMLLAVLAGIMASCSGGDGNASVRWVSEDPTYSGRTDIQNSPFIHQPGRADVSTVERNRPFSVTPNFFYTTQADCDHPCPLAIYPTPMQVPGTAVNYVASAMPGDPLYADNPWPCEYYDAATVVTGPICADHTGPGDQMQVICQVKGQAVQDSRGVSSVWWNKVLIPQSKIIQGLEQLEPAGLSAFYGWAPDIWAGNTGDHGIPCP
jgi:hypothetical protein